MHAFVRLSDYFDDSQHYQWLYNACLKLYKGLEKDDECIWPHLIHGILISAANLDIPVRGILILAYLLCPDPFHEFQEAEFTGSISVILEDAFSSQYVNVSNMALRSALVYLKSNPSSTTVINLVIPHLMKNLEPADG